MEVEWLILADSAQVVGNKLYLLGGGWDRLQVNAGFPVSHHCAIALAIRVPWNETNRKHTVQVEIISEAGETEEPKPLATVQGQFEVGRPAGIPQGQDQRFQLAFETNLALERAGVYVIVARIEGQEVKRTQFTAAPGPGASTRR
ncbi:MAG: hypothetical protein FJ316_04160 [SAR202 cluster bacterium]|nr:hypothetical protein [SAR202 cluster bacterium]